MFSLPLKPNPKLSSYTFLRSWTIALSKMQQMDWMVVSLKPIVINKMYVSSTFWL